MCDGELRFVGRRPKTRSLFKTRPRSETAHEKPLAPRVLSISMVAKERTIRKVIGGEGNFRAAGIFFRYQILCMNFLGHCMNIF